ncbi:MAG: hypothetical protein PVH65_13955 [Chloroflexota bacterium]
MAQLLILATSALTLEGAAGSNMEVSDLTPAIELTGRLLKPVQTGKWAAVMQI